MYRIVLQDDIIVTLLGRGNRTGVVLTSRMCDTILYVIWVTICVNNTTVMLQPFDVTNADKSKHKFMVQSMFPPPGEVKLEEIVRKYVTL